MYDCKMYDCKMYDCKMYDCKMYDCKMYDCKMCCNLKNIIMMLNFRNLILDRTCSNMIKTVGRKLKITHSINV